MEALVAAVEADDPRRRRVVGIVDHEVHRLGPARPVVEGQHRVIHLDAREVGQEELHRPARAQLGHRLAGHSLLLPRQRGEGHAPVRGVHERPESPAEPRLDRRFLRAGEGVERPVARDHHATVRGQRGPPGAAADHLPHARGVRLGHQTGPIGFEAREAPELPDRPRHQEAPVAVDVRLAPVVDPAVVAKREGVHAEPEDGPGRGRQGEHRGVDSTVTRGPGCGYATCRRPRRPLGGSSV
jgi:hypothetical protein